MADATAIADSRTEGRISWLTLVVGYSAAVIAHFLHRPDWAVGLFFGTGLSWINYRALRRGIDMLVDFSRAQQGQEKPQVPWWSSLLVMFRYALIGITVYVIFINLHIPLASIMVGLCALAAAAIVASVWEILAPGEVHQDR
jgi:hypothetical protein